MAGAEMRESGSQIPDRREPHGRKRVPRHRGDRNQPRLVGGCGEERRRDGGEVGPRPADRRGRPRGRDDRERVRQGVPGPPRHLVQVRGQRLTKRGRGGSKIPTGRYTIRPCPPATSSSAAYSPPRRSPSSSGSRSSISTPTAPPFASRTTTP